MILFFAIEDWANVSYNFAKSLQTVGIDAHAFTMNEHIMEYPEQAEVYSTFFRMQKLVESAECIVFMHSDPNFIKIPFDLAGKKKVVFHGGSTYRDNSEAINMVYNGFVDISLVQTGDLLGLGAKNEKWIFPAVDTDTIKPKKGIGEKIVVAHFPRHPDVKGTGVILDAVNEIVKEHNFEFMYDPKVVPYRENLERISKCDIYIEALQLELNGKQYGEWGVTALEAASMGKVVISHFLSKYRYEEEIGKCAILGANNATELKEKLSMLLSSKPGFMEELQKESRDWVINNHGYKATGERLKELLEL